MDWFEFYESLKDEFEDLANLVTPQFGTRERPFLFANLLPERVLTNVLGLTFGETVIGFVTAPALDNTRYSPAQQGQSGMTTAEINVTLGHTDTADKLTARDHDAIVQMLERSLTMDAAAVAINWVNRVLLAPHLIKNEIQRAQALLLGSVRRDGTNGFTEVVDLAVPPGHRPEVPGGTVAAPAGWFDADYEILLDILEGQRVLAAEGYSVTGIMTDSEVTTLMKRNRTLSALRGGIMSTDAGGVLQISNPQLSDTTLAGILADYSLPGITRYDSTYRYPIANEQSRTRKFIQPTDTHHYFLMFGNTERSETIDTGEEPIVLGNTLGYYAIGRNPGKATSGRTIYTEPHMRKPEGLYGESIQTGFPVFGNPDAVYVIRIRKPTP